MAPERPVSTPPSESVLARIERAGPAALDDRELLALLGIGVDDPTLAAGGGLRGLLDDPDDRLRAVVLPRADRARVHALHEVHARWMEARLTRDGAPFTSPAHTRRYIEARLRGYRSEVFACLFLTNRHQVIAWEEVFFGTLDGTSVHPRVVVRRAPRSQRRRHRVRPQSSQRLRRSQPRRPRHHPAARRSARARRRAPHRPLRRRRRRVRRRSPRCGLL